MHVGNRSFTRMHVGNQLGFVHSVQKQVQYFLDACLVLANRRRDEQADQLESDGCDVSRSLGVSCLQMGADD